MAQGFNDNLYLIDLSYLNTPSEVVYDLSSILEAEPARNQRIKLKLGKVDFNKSQLLSIKSLIESINSTVAIVEGKSDITRNAAISAGLVYQNSNDMVPDIAFTSSDVKLEDTTVYTEVKPELFPDVSPVKEEVEQQNETENTEEHQQNQDVQPQVTYQPEGESVELQTQKFETTEENLKFENNNQNWVEEQSQVQSFEEGFSNNNWAKPQSDDNSDENNGNEKVDMLFGEDESQNQQNQNNQDNQDNQDEVHNNDEQPQEQPQEPENKEMPPVPFAEHFEAKNDNSDLMVKDEETTGIKKLEDIPLDIPKPEEIQEELDVIYSAERKLEDVFATTGLKEEKFQSLKETPVAEEKEYTQYDFELEAFPTKYLKQTICAGQFISFEGNLVIIGDCHEGAEISASGDITVWGTLSGSAHAGKNGNEKCKIRALKMNASQLRIANCYVKRPAALEEGNVSTVPEEAMICKGEIVVYKIYK